ncbi:hypothetical protein AR457_34505 [Streptomyces agglomeratus]|uniref:Uncharacterized protein n=1 Tax=Streptomyces agglomeratus TaxID=285458 RepID=A0A1E5PH01_9ACTN|nr:hypothetical protein [Streptomyces agglomeratus]OEJ28797.1 hypothetical protein AS594_34500 [Streptomyces agglomeratus]OEJ37124.1 hypothetical protein BGK70_02000 [Streptomyces agglomeratus]OEJ48478.1 hypothetical protein AR457_34505 [Streptomyces agglomeratus]OEJ49679.1 hypothetical protein BGK72_01535 [Streptomyces agglomeratus]
MEQRLERALQDAEARAAALCDRLRKGAESRALPHQQPQAPHSRAQEQSTAARHTGTIASARAGVEAVAADAVRQGHVYLREVVRNQAEPVSEPVFHDELPEIKLPSSARELLDYPGVASNSTLAPPETVSCEDLERRWTTVQSGPVAPHTERLHVVHGEDTGAGGA